jgi:hypothetical protein
MNYWIFTVTSQKSDGRTFPAEEIFQQRMKDEFWGLGERTPNRKNVQKGDRIVFYLGNPEKCFAGTANLGSASFALSPDEQDRLAHSTELFRTPYGVRLEEICIWDQVRTVENLLVGLDFIQNKEFWGTYFQGGVRQISEKDFTTILRGSSGLAQTRMPPAADLESESEFALESHLEEFLDQNWDNIDFGMKLEKYNTEEQSGRQFPAGPWSIDFLCINEETDDLVVVELKRGKTSDATVGQILRYIGYVRKNVARPGQKVRGIIIAKSVDDALQYALETSPDVSVLTYRVDFRLSRLVR